jgi:ribonuclease HI
MQRRKMEVQATCTICGNADEDAFHALVTFPHAKGLWYSMRQCWDLPSEEIVENSGKEWLLQLLSKLNEIQRMMVLMVLWRAWHVHNELTHNKPAPPIEVSKRFLCSYVDALLMIKQHPTSDACKGKQIISYSGRVVKCKPKESTTTILKKWDRPPRGRLKLNVDGSYVEHSGEGGAGMILRDDNGNVIFTACRSLPYCALALEAEMAACDEGLRLAMSWSTEPIDLEMDCAIAVNMISAKENDQSTLVHLLRNIQESLGERETTIRKIDRSQNEASHTMAKMGRELKRTQFWMRSFPSVLENVINKECNVSMI